MFFQRKKFLDSMTGKLILANVIVFLAIMILKTTLGEQAILDFIALRPASILAGQNLWTLITSMFAHFSFWHLFVNMFSLYYIGTFVEKLVGSKRLLISYLASGLFAGIFWSVLSFFFGTSSIGASVFGNPLIYGVGASGALFGLVGILAMLTPRKKVYLLSGPIIAIVLQYLLYGIFPNNEAIMTIVSLLINIYIIFVLFSMFSFRQGRRKLAVPIELPFWLLPIVAIVPLILIGLFMSLPIGNMAHLGGLIFGLIYAAFLKLKFPRKTAILSRQVK